VGPLMGRIPLRFNEMKRHFSLTAGIALGRPGMGPNASLGTWLRNEFIFDTGTTTTSIAEEVAERLGVDVEKLALVDVGGVTGVAKRPFLPEVDIWFLGDDFQGVRLSGVVVLRILREKRREQKSGVRQERIVRLPALNLLGLDAVEALGARVTFDFKKKAGWIEW